MTVTTRLLCRTFTATPLLLFASLAAQSQALSAPPSAAAQAVAPTPDEARFVDDLLRRMTLDEKVGQMEQAAGQSFYTSPAQAEDLARTGKVGSFLFFTDPVRINQLQHIAMEQSRLHIPLLFGYDVIHGFRTIAPVPLAMASTWNPALIERTQSMAAREARAAGVTWAFAPMVDIARDPRWGRIMESAGEDPYLGERVAAAQVRGFQGERIGAPGHVLASVKHFGGYGAVTGGRDYDDADISDEMLENVYLRPYRAGVNAGTATIMTAYMNLNGVPATGNMFLLRDTLRQQWGFQGIVVSDWESVKNMQTHGFTATPLDTAVQAARAGVNVEMTSSLYRAELPAAVKAGMMTTQQIDALVRPILLMKHRLGLFEHPYVDMDAFKRETLSPEQRHAAELAAEQATVLLKNENSTLPLSKSLHTLAVIGPLADSKLDTMGSWAIHGDRNDTVTVAQGLREALPNATVTVAEGLEIERGSATIFDEQVIPDKPHLTTPALRDAAFAKAVDAARNAEAVVLVLGEAQTMSGEDASRAHLNLPGEQERLLETVSALGKPVVLVLMAGRPLTIEWAADHVPAILNAWYPGTEGGHAVARLLLGDANPSGHLPLSWPRDSAQEPLYYATRIPQNPDNVAHRYWDIPSTPRYPFGFGLTYSNMQVSDLKVETPQLRATDTLRAHVTVTNPSKIAGQEVVQLYVHQRAGSNAQPRRELKAFEKVQLQPGETRQVTLSMPAQDLSYWSSATHTVVLEPGDFDVWVGSDSNATLHTQFAITR